jgi:hypothetical protein
MVDGSGQLGVFLTANQIEVFEIAPFPLRACSTAPCVCLDVFCVSYELASLYQLGARLILLYLEICVWEAVSLGDRLAPGLLSVLDFSLKLTSVGGTPHIMPLFATRRS